MMSEEVSTAASERANGMLWRFDVIPYYRSLPKCRFWPVLTC